MKYYRKLEGKRLYLSPISEEDADLFATWLNDLDITRNLTISHVQLSYLKEKQILGEMIKRGDQVFSIVLNDNDRLIGNCSLNSIDHLDRKAELGIFIGDKNAWSKGYGQEAMQLLLDYGFNILNLHNIYLRVFSHNKKAIHSYERIGFKHAGRLRETNIIGGKMHDELFMDILESEFTSQYLRSKLNPDD